MRSLDDLRSENFCGFLPIQSLRTSVDIIPDEPGVYVVVWNLGSTPSFLSEGTGGRFKKRNPNVPITHLQSRWIDRANVIYVGQAGGKGSASTLRSRLRQYFDFGAGKPVSHWGGRLIWQLENAQNLVVAWLPIKDIDPLVIERDLIARFISVHGALPFANLRR